MRLCVVGPGAIADAHLRAFAAEPLVEPAWVVGRTEERAVGFADKWEFPHATTDLAQALADPAVDLVLIASPNSLHASQTLDALEAGKHVIAEIPIGMSLDEALSVTEKAASAGLRLLACHTMRSFPAIRWLKARVAAGELTISQITSFVGTARRHNENWVPGTRNWVDNGLWHHSCHYLDASLWILGAEEAEGVCAQFGRAHPEFGMKMDVSVSLRTPDSVLVSYSGTYNIAAGRNHMFFVADQGLFLLQGNRLFDEEGVELFPAVDWGDVGAQNAEMIGSIRSGSPSDFDACSVLPVMRALEQAQAFDTVAQS